jgi:hypothetical protein
MFREAFLKFVFKLHAFCPCVMMQLLVIYTTVVYRHHYDVMRPTGLFALPDLIDLLFLHEFILMIKI